MSLSPTDLDALRREIDQLDDRLHDLLMQRAALVSRVRALKPGGGGLFLRPGREAQILRRLVGRHQGTLPVASLGHVLREIIASLYVLQGPLKIAVHAPEKSVGYWDMARKHFGSATPMTLHRSAQNVLRTVMQGRDTIGLLSLPQEGEAEPWWPQIVSETPGVPRIIGRLPFVDDMRGRLENVTALVVAQADPEPSGDDISLIGVNLAADGISRARFAELLAEAGLQGRIIAYSPAHGGEQLVLSEVPGFVTKDDRRLATLLAGGSGAVTRVVPLGAYAVPVACDA